MDKAAVKSRRKELGISCMLNTEVGAVLAVIRRPLMDNYLSPQDCDYSDSSVQQSLKSLRALIFNPQQEWRTIDPSIYLSPFLEVVQSDEIPASATAVALSSILKILKIEIFDEKTPGAKDAMNSIVSGITSCRLEKTDPVSEDAVMMRILQVLVGIMKHPASNLLEDQAVCTIVNTCFQVVQQSARRGDLLQRNGRYTMHELIQIIFARLPDFEVRGDEGEDSESDTDEIDVSGGYGIRCCIDIFHFLCSLLNVVEVVESAEGTTVHTADEDVQIFALVLINSAIELCGDAIGQHPKLLRMIQDDLFHHLIHYGSSSSPLVLSMICSCILNIYHFLRKFVRLQLEAFFAFVLLRVTSMSGYIQLQEVALEGIINFCRQPSFIVESYVNYDCDPICRSLFEEIGKVLCRHTFPTSGPLTSLQIQAFEGLVIVIHNIADNIDKEYDDGEGDCDNDSSSLKPRPVEIKEYTPFWIEKANDDFDAWIDHIRVRKAQKRKLLIASNHFNRDEKKGLEYLKFNNLVSDPPDPKAFASFFRFTPGLDKTIIGDYLGDPDDFHVKVLKDFTQTFEFTGMSLDTALRTFLETFRLPGESQKIERIIEAFSERFFQQQSSEIFASKDTVHILCYSLIMLNTDQHNPQVKKKMTEDEFIRNNRAINAGKDLPREYLSELFQSISSNAIVLSSSSFSVEMNPNKWIELINRTKMLQPFSLCEFDRRIGRDMFASIAGPSIAALSSFFEHADDDEMLHECVDALISIARVAQYGLEDILDELVASFCKFTTLLNPYSTPEETLFTFSHDMKPRIATLAVFTLANSFGDSIRGGWRNIVDCLLKLKKLRLLPQSVVEFDTSGENVSGNGIGSESDGNPSSRDTKLNRRQNACLIGRFSHFLSVDSMEDSVALGMSEFEQNLKVIKQCRIGQIFSNSSNLPDTAILNLGRSLIFAAAGRGQRFSTPTEEEETVMFCWDLIIAVALANVHRFNMFWPSYHDYLLTVANFPLFSPVPFVEKGIPGILTVCTKIIASQFEDRLPEELIFRSITLMWKMEKEIIDTCCDTITEYACKIIMEYSGNLQTQIGWKSVLQLLSLCGRHPETYEQSVDALISLMSTNASHLSRSSYAYCIDCAFSFVTLRNSPLEKNLKILDLMTDSVSLLIQWYKTASAEPGNSYSVASSGSNSSMEENLRGGGNFAHFLFLKLCEAFRKTSLARREEIRNRAVASLQKSFVTGEELEFTPTGCLTCINHVIFPTIDDLHEKLLDYSRRDNAEREMRAMEGTLKMAMQMVTNVYMHYLKLIVESPDFRTFWLGVLRRMDTCMKADLGDYGENKLHEVVPELLKSMISTMKEREILVRKQDDDLWEITYIQIQWIAPSLKEELFPDEEL
ncbi:PREDICTED: ARF guanine-nucleotide exchange factor GNL2 [Tarenaya hassleriana]|uniref:ARF guanine-nucleotide exchange factor GNL2 n=1 Tax=Tarenaya hassleriana TaxID=28532 RepID=UPI00053C818E|nr:PREDICTED: ARF guanine-nucleotide exchange factor GNL2 [Tarenaya hassleriana]